MIKLLRPINKDFVDDYRKSLILNMEFIDEAYDRYTHGFIDVYDHCLSLEEADERLSSFKEHNLQYETRFIDLIKSIYKLNKGETIIEFGYNELDDITILRILQELDYTDKLNFINQIKYLDVKEATDFFIVEDIELIELMVKLATRELYFPVINFISIGVSVVGNYDLSFPMFLKDKHDLDKYEKLARQNSLYIREQKII